MPTKPATAAGPAGGLRDDARPLRPWRWRGRGALTSAPVRCAPDEWYIVRLRPAYAAVARRTALMARFLRHGAVLTRRCVALHARGGPGADELLGWVQSPARATHVEVALPAVASAPQIEELHFQDVSERDPKCHPMANTPRWAVYQPPFPLRRVILPASLYELTDLVDWAALEVIDHPVSRDKLAKRLRGAAVVLDPRWVSTLGLTWADVQQLAASAWLLVDLDTTAALLAKAGLAHTQVERHASAHGIMSARVEYADVPTRGHALQDVLPLASLDAHGGFTTRVLRANRSWKRYADGAGFATLLASETPWVEHHGDILSGALPVGRGELITTDLPWMVAGRHGRQLAPRSATHLLRMHLGAPLADHLQYWNRWDDDGVVVRDICDFARRTAPLQALRWQPTRGGVEQLGVALVPPGPVTEQVLLRTGRIDGADRHDGVPPEAMCIFIRWLAREVREQTDWARQHLAARVVTWQFDAAEQVKFAVNYDSALSLGDVPTRVVHLRRGGEADFVGPPRPVSTRVAREDLLTLDVDEGLYGDGSLAFQEELTQRLRAVLER